MTEDLQENQPMQNQQGILVNVATVQSQMTKKIIRNDSAQKRLILEHRRSQGSTNTQSNLNFMPVRTNEDVYA